MVSLQIGETKERTHFLMTDNQHRVFFLCNQMKQCNNCKVGPCTHTLYLEDSMNYHDLWDSVVSETSSKENLIPDFEQHFEKLYFTDKNDYDWWEKDEDTILEPHRSIERQHKLGKD